MPPVEVCVGAVSERILEVSPQIGSFFLCGLDSSRRIGLDSKVESIITMNDGIIQRLLLELACTLVSESQLHPLHRTMRVHVH